MIELSDRTDFLRSHPELVVAVHAAGAAVEARRRRPQLCVRAATHSSERTELLGHI